MPFIEIDDDLLQAHCETLAASDKTFSRILKDHGVPSLWARPKGFPTLIHIILEQQVSLASAQAAFDKMLSLIGEINPHNILKLSDDEMKSAYFSRQKMSYSRNLAHSVNEGTLDLTSLVKCSDDAVRSELMKIKGIGKWTSDIYLLLAMLRPDIMPRGDLALHVAWQKLNGLENRPTSDQFQAAAKKWKPFRSVAARLLWHYYLSSKIQKGQSSPKK